MGSKLKYQYLSCGHIVLEVLLILFPDNIIATMIATNNNNNSNKYIIVAYFSKLPQVAQRSRNLLPEIGPKSLKEGWVSYQLLASSRYPITILPGDALTVEQRWQVKSTRSLHRKVVPKHQSSLLSSSLQRSPPPHDI